MSIVNASGVASGLEESVCGAAGSPLGRWAMRPRTAARSEFYVRLPQVAVRVTRHTAMVLARTMK